MSTEEEKNRPPLEKLPTYYRAPEDALLTRKEFDLALSRLKKNKAPGPDGIPVEVFKLCPSIQDELFEFIKYVWDNEALPTNLAEANFKMIVIK